MTTKTTALLISACVAVLCLFSIIAPNDPFFYFISSNEFTNAGRLILASWLVILAYKQRFVFMFSKKLSMFLAAGLVIFGVVGLTSFSLQNAIYGLIDPADFILMIGGGLLAGSSALELKQGKKQLSSLQLPRLELRPLIGRLQTKISL